MVDFRQIKLGTVSNLLLIQYFMDTYQAKIHLIILIVG